MADGINSRLDSDRFAQCFLGQGRAGADTFEQICLSRFQFDQAAKHVQDVEQLGRVFGQPSLRLDIAERRGCATVADLRTLPVQLPIAEPLGQNMLA